MPQAKVIESDVLPTLLAVCLSFRQRWDEYVSDEAYEPNHVYVALLQTDTVSEFSAVFAAVEGLLEQDDEDIRNAVTTGLLEDLYFKAEDAGIFPRVWRKYFGPRTIHAWTLILSWEERAIDRVCRLTRR